MARIFQTGFESGAVNASVSSGCSASTAQKRTGSYSLRQPNRDDYATFSLGSSFSEVYGRIGFYRTTLTPDVEGTIFGLLNSDGTVIAEVSYKYNTGLVYAKRNSTNLTVSAVPLVSGWNCLEIYLSIADSGGRFVVKNNGVTIIDYTGDTKESSYSNVGLLRVGKGVASGGFDNPEHYFDDIAVNDTTGSVNNSWIGQGGIRPLLVNADGDHTGLTPSTGSDNYALVDEVPASDTDYVSGSTKDVYDLYTVDTSGMPASYTVSAVKWIARARVTEDAANITPVIRSESTTEQQSDIALSTSFTVKELIMETDPIDDAAWTKTKIDALEIGAAVG